MGCVVPTALPIGFPGEENSQRRRISLDFDWRFRSDALLS